MVKKTKNISGICKHNDLSILLFQNKAKLVTYVIASGLTYGMEESIFHYLFKVSLVPYRLLFGMFLIFTNYAFWHSNDSEIDVCWYT